MVASASGPKIAAAMPEDVLDGLEGVVVESNDPKQKFYCIDFSDGERRYLGKWMLEAATAGKLDMMPVVTVR